MAVAQQVARLLLRKGAVTLRPTAPFRFASGLLSPIYCDNRLLMSYPRERRQVMLAFRRLLREGQIPVEVIAGTATAGVPHAAWLAEELNLPMVYVRSQPKGHGKEQFVEGVLPKGRQTVVIEDLVTTGGSSLACVAALQQIGAIVEHVLAIFSYGFPAAAEGFARAGVHLHTLTTLPIMLDVAVADSTLSPSERDMVVEWAADPKGWSQAREGAAPAQQPSK